MKPFKLLVILCLISLAKSSIANEISSNENVVNLTNIYRADSVLTIEFIDEDEKDKKKQTKFEAKLSDSFWSLTFPDEELIKIAKSRNVLDKVGATKYTVLWKGKDLTPKQQVCFLSGEFMWYSTFFDFDHHFYPLNVSNKFQLHTLATLGSIFKPAAVSGSLLENLFITTAGFVIMLDDLHMWTFSINNGKYCFSISGTKLNNDQMDHPAEFKSIKLRILAANSAVSAWKYAVKEFEFIKRPARVPSEAQFMYPVWPVSTIVEKNNNKYLAILNAFFVKNDEQHFPKVHLYLDDVSETQQPNFKITALKEEEEHSFVQFLNQGHLISVRLATEITTNYADQFSDIVIGNTNSPTGKLDFSKSKTIDWLAEQLRQFNQTYKLDAFTLADGTADCFQTEDQKQISKFKVYDEEVNKYPNFISTLYVQSVTSLKPSSLFFETAYKLQSAPAFVRLISNAFEMEAALQQVIPRLLTLSLAGYQFIIAELEMFRPETGNQEVYLQWIQAVLFFPALQIPCPPWTFKNATVATTVGKLLKIRDRVLFSGKMGPKLFELAKKWITKGEPIIRPMWFADADDAQLANITDQYMIGDHLIVAPITSEGQLERDVYLPKGRWCYMGDGTQHGKANGGSTVKQIKKPSKHLVIFFLRMYGTQKCNVKFDKFIKSLPNPK